MFQGSGIDYTKPPSEFIAEVGFSNAWRVYNAMINLDFDKLEYSTYYPIINGPDLKFFDITKIIHNTAYGVNVVFLGGGGDILYNILDNLNNDPKHLQIVENLRNMSCEDRASIESCVNSKEIFIKASQASSGFNFLAQKISLFASVATGIYALVYKEAVIDTAVKAVAISATLVFMDVASDIYKNIALDATITQCFEEHNNTKALVAGEIDAT